MNVIKGLDDSEWLGVGGFGIVISHSTLLPAYGRHKTGGQRGAIAPSNAVKLLYDIDECKALIEEAQIQMAARKLLDGIVHVPQISTVLTEPIVWKGTQYLCGIAMERIPNVKRQGVKGGSMPLSEPVHIVLGDDPIDLDTSWGKTIGKPVGPNNPSRGFFASGEFLEDLWEEEGSAHTVDSVAFTMGRALRALVDGGIVPVDLEWIYGGDGAVHLIDFGLCRMGRVDPRSFFFQKGGEGLAYEIYVPHEGDRGYSALYRGYFG